MNTKTNIRILILILTIIPIVYCNPVTQLDNSTDGNDDRWLIPKDEVVDGGPGKDGIPALEYPEFISANDVGFLSPDDLVIGIRIGNTVKAYPHNILDYHEIVNDSISDRFFALSYCPLTGTALSWEVENDGSNITFGVSGLLYNSNLIPYDRRTNSNWSQIFFQSVNGQRIEEKAKLLQIIETTWETWKLLFPDSLVLSTNTSYARDYRIYPYGDYKTSNNLLFSVNNEDSRLSRKERVHGIILGDKTKVYTIKSFSSGTTVLNEDINENNIVVAIDGVKNFAVSFIRPLKDNKILEFSAVEGKLPVLMKDDSGTEWDIFGKAVSGKYAGDQLTPATSFNSYWFGWAAFYPNALIN